ncbi:MAG: hypothetical protein P8Z80_19260, partial [Pseudolabrys sp.]
FSKMFDDAAEHARTKAAGMYAVLIGFNLAAWAWALIEFHGRPVLFGTAFLAYGWAFVNPIRKLYYNMTITFVSVVAALVIGGIEALGLIGDKLALQGPFWNFIGMLSDNFGVVGYAIVAFFIASWVVSFLVYKAKGYDRLEASV